MSLWISNTYILAVNKTANISIHAKKLQIRVLSACTEMMVIGKCV